MKIISIQLQNSENINIFPVGTVVSITDGSVEISNNEVIALSEVADPPEPALPEHTHAVGPPITQEGG